MKKIILRVLLSITTSWVASASMGMGQEFDHVMNAFADWTGDSPLSFAPGTEIGPFVGESPQKVAIILKKEYKKLGYGELDAGKVLKHLIQLRRCYEEKAKINSISDALTTLGQTRTMCYPMTTFMAAQAVLRSRK